MKNRIRLSRSENALLDAEALMAKSLSEEINGLMRKVNALGNTIDARRAKCFADIAADHEFPDGFPDGAAIEERLEDGRRVVSWEESDPGEDRVNAALELATKFKEEVKATLLSDLAKASEEAKRDNLKRNPITAEIVNAWPEQPPEGTEVKAEIASEAGPLPPVEEPHCDPLPNDGVMTEGPLPEVHGDKLDPHAEEIESAYQEAVGAGKIPPAPEDMHGTCDGMGGSDYK